MRKNILIILGNGFSIDLLAFLEKDLKKGEKKVNLSNLFQLGEEVLWPGDNLPGFLSYKHCSNLWTLGARPGISNDMSNELMESILSCANISSLKDGIENKIYIKAYKELERYLVSLFVHYTEEVDLPNQATEKEYKEWGWYKFFKKYYSDKDIEHVDIISLNYDIWLEQLLTLWKIPYSISSFGGDEKFRIYKPHGSIGIKSKARLDKAAFSTSCTKASFDNHNTDEFSFSIDNIDCLNMSNAIIPPAGDSNRLHFSWATDQRSKAIEAAKSLTQDDLLLICGVSYWHVDRYEIDQYLTAIQSSLEVTMINPNPPQDLMAVLMTLFENFKVFRNSSLIQSI